MPQEIPSEATIGDVAGRELSRQTAKVCKDGCTQINES